MTPIMTLTRKITNVNWHSREKKSKFYYYLKFGKNSDLDRHENGKSALDLRHNDADPQRGKLRLNELRSPFTPYPQFTFFSLFYSSSIHI